MAKATKAQITQRVQTVYGLLVQGMGHADIVRHVSEKHAEWGVGERQVENYIRRALEIVSTEASAHRDAAREIAIVRLNAVLALTWKMMDMQRYLAAQDQLNRLIGSYPPPPAQVIAFAGLNPTLLQQVVEALQAIDQDPETTFKQLIEAAHARAGKE